MKSIQEGESHLPRTTMMSHGPGRYRGFDDLKERAKTDVVLSVFFAVIVALCIVMSVGLYHWTHPALVFPPEAAGIQEAIPWSR